MAVMSVLGSDSYKVYAAAPDIITLRILHIVTVRKGLTLSDIPVLKSAMETGRCTVHADDDRVETPSWKIK